MTDFTLVPERRYTLSEIDSMRAAIEDIHDFEGVTGLFLGCAKTPKYPDGIWPIRESEMICWNSCPRQQLTLIEREELLRTYMLAGIEPIALFERAEVARRSWAELKNRETLRLSK